MGMNRIVYNPRSGWFFKFSMLTGSKHVHTGEWFPTIAHGKASPPVMHYKVGPFPSADEAVAAI